MIPMTRPFLPLLALAFALSPAVFAQENEAYDPMHVVVSVLGLAEDQTQRWAGILQAREEAIHPLAEQARARHEVLKTALESATPDVVLVGKTLIEIRKIEETIGKINTEAAAHFEELLTPEQKQRLDFIRQAARTCPAVPAFGAAGLL